MTKGYKLTGTQDCPEIAKELLDKLNPNGGEITEYHAEDYTD